MFCVVWLAVAMNFSDSVAAGTYYFSEPGFQSRLVLLPDHTFHQELTRPGHAAAGANGTWRRLGESGISFSPQFLVLPGMESYADGEPYGVMRKTLGLFVHLEMADGAVLQCCKIDSTGESLAGAYKCSDEPNATVLLEAKPDHTFTQSS